MLEITTQRAKEFELAPQGENESDQSFRERVAGELRDQGHLMEAHEAYNNCLYDDPNGNAMTGIIGAIAQQMQGINYGSAGNRQIGDDIAAGELTLKSHNEPPMAPDMALLMISLFGGK